MSDHRPIQRTLAALADHRAVLDAASARLARVSSAADRLTALRAVERSMAQLGRHIGETRRLAALGTPDLIS